MQSQHKLLEGKKALITGASRGIGSMISMTFAAENATLILADRDVKGLEETMQACKAKGAGAVHICPVDFYLMASVDAFAKTVLEQHRGVDILVNNAGGVSKTTRPDLPDDITKNESPLEGDPDAWSACFKLNLETPMRLIRALSPRMAAKKQGVIINITSRAGVERVPEVPAYLASKWALRGWTKSCHEALRPHGIKVSSIAPDAVDTPLAAILPLKRSMLLRPEDVAEACMFVCRCSSNAVPEEICIRAVQPYV